ncbi:hypothetical protein B0J11DRAFT_541743 [Dendryphion nanum]|uniref:Uncharacterized protein n=1 Tax=Dendryphion nanum TaxID=256645 RepID=A0A9P9IB80_9PLEO|nr:hypothetical protein B0J11DRAFT_541743 [Dendryphion nanum]
MALDTSKVRASKSADIANYFKELRSSITNESITDALIDAIESGSIEPSVSIIWLGVSDSPITLKKALQQRISIQVRHAGIKRLKKVLESTAKWKNTWDGLGGTRGLLELFSNFSVNEIRAVCSALGSCAKRDNAEEKRATITELLKALLPQAFPDTEIRTADNRPLDRHYERLVSSCTPEVVTEVFGHGLDDVWKEVPRRLLLSNHPETFRAITLISIFGGGKTNHTWLSRLAQQYPATSGPNPGISASMQFSINLLKKLVEEEKVHVSGKEFINQIVEPLIRRAFRKRIEWTDTQALIRLTVIYLDKHPEVGMELSRDHGSLLHLAALCWSRKPDLFAENFGRLLRHANRGETSMSFYIFNSLLKGVAKSRRYALLHYCYQEAFGRDLNSAEHLKDIPGPLPHQIWSGIYPDQALDLLARMRTIRGDDGLIERGMNSHQSVTNNHFDPSSYFGDFQLVKIVLTTWNADLDEAEKLAETEIQGHKKKAVESRDPENRATYARAVLDYSVASGSLRLLKDTLLWVRRFTRDPTTVPMIYMNPTLEMTIVLSGIPKKLKEYMNAAFLTHQVEVGNHILELLFETTFSALREPWFSLTHWTGVLGLFRKVVSYRMECAKTLKDYRFDNEEIFDILWRDTLRMLIDCEKNGLKSAHDRLEANKIGGIMDCEMNGESITFDNRDEHATLRFLDELAKARNQLWKDYRPTVHPAAAMLPDPFPKGLPIQALTRPYIVEGASLEMCPYLAARANEAVQLKPEAALKPIPTDEDTLNAIGPFIDDYRIAVAMLHAESQSPEEMIRMEAIWQHIEGPLTGNRMTANEAKRYWKRVIVPHSGAEEYGVEEWPVLPTTERSSEIEEWNPLPTGLKDIKARAISPLTYVDLSRSIQPIGFTNIWQKLDSAIITPCIPGKVLTKPGIWDWERNDKARNTSARRDGQIVSSLLYLDSQIAPTKRILSVPFPSTDDARYPALFLDHQFLTTSQSTLAAIQILKMHINHVPPALLLQVASNAANTLSGVTSGDAIIELEKITFNLVSLLGKSDRPSLAANLAMEIIMRYPDASSWHRKLLAEGYFKRLSAAEAEACFHTFSGAIITKLEEQNRIQAKKSQSQETSTRAAEESDKPLVKVTTVKLLAERLRRSEFVPADFAVNVLAIILQKASHVDIKHAVLDSLLSMLATPSSELVQHIMTVLESLIPVIGNLNERLPILDADWDKASASLILPEVSSSWQDCTSMWFKLLEFSSYSKETSKINVTQLVMQRLLLPGMVLLKGEMQKWISIFLRKHGIDEKAQQEFKVPVVPGRSQSWSLAIVPPEYAPLYLLEQLVEYTIFNINPPAPIAELNKKLRADPDLESQPDVMMWLENYGQGIDIIVYGGLTPLPDYFNVTTKLVEGGITTKRVQELYLNMLTIVLLLDSPHYLFLSTLINQLWPNFASDGADWSEYKKPVVEAVVAYVNTLRTKDWLSNPERRPNVLPDVYPQRLWLLAYPCLYEHYAPSPPTTPDEHVALKNNACKTFADQIAIEVEKLPGTMYHTRLSQIQVCLDQVHELDRIRVALHLGDISKTRLSWLTVPDLLRVELAAHLIGQDYGLGVPHSGYNQAVGIGGCRGERRAAVYRFTSDRKDEEVLRLKKELEEMVGAWRKSENEGVRKAGWAIELRDDEDDWIAKAGGGEDRNRRGRGGRGRGRGWFRGGW